MTVINSGLATAPSGPGQALHKHPAVPDKEEVRGSSPLRPTDLTARSRAGSERSFGGPHRDAPTVADPGTSPLIRATLRFMRGTTYAVVGVLAFVVAGFVRGGLRYSADPELVLALSWGLAAAGLVGVLAGGVAIGIHISRQ